MQCSVYIARLCPSVCQLHASFHCRDATDLRTPPWVESSRVLGPPPLGIGFVCWRALTVTAKWGPQPIAASDSTIMAAKQALKRLLPAPVCSGWSAYGELSTHSAEKSTQCLGIVSNIATVAYRLPACRRRSHCRPGSSELAVHARYEEHYFE